MRFLKKYCFATLCSVLVAITISPCQASPATVIAERETAPGATVLTRTDAPAPGYALDRCLDDDLVTLPDVAHQRYTLNGEDVSGTITFRSSDKLEVWNVKGGVRATTSILLTREALGLTDTPCGKDGKPMSVEEWAAQKHSRNIGIGIGIAVVTTGLLAGFVILRRRRSGAWSRKPQPRYANRTRQQGNAQRKVRKK